MLKKIWIPFLIFIVVAFVFAGTLPPAEAATQESPAIAIGEILAYYQTENGAENVQQLIDGYLAETAGETAEWFLWALRQYHGSYSFTSYSSALLQYLEENNISNASTREKYALGFLASGANSPYIAETADTAIGEMGVMSYIYGLHLINNGVISKTWTADTVIDALLALKHVDGGWSIRGDASLPSDIDVTAMALQALTPYAEQQTIADAVTKALNFLSQNQTEDGDYAAFGGRNAESCAQVAIALCSLGMNPLTDARFIKEGNNVLDGLRRYRLPNGTYSHFAGEGYSLSATQQAFNAYVALWRYQNNLSPYYLLGDYVFAPPTELPNAEELTGTANVFASWKIWAAFSIAAGTVLLIGYLLLRRRGGLKECAACALIAILCIGTVAFADIQSKDEYYNHTLPLENEITVTLVILCDTLIGNISPYIPADGVILSSSQVRIEEGSTVFDAIKEATRIHAIPMEYRGGAASGATYIAGIHSLYEFDYGELSGWMYAVNGSTTGLGCAEYTLSDGDSVLWYYTLDLGRDASVYGVEGGL